MKELKCRFVYHMWVPDNIDDTQKDIINVHVSCIKRYIELFDDIIIVLAYDSNKDLMNKLKRIFVGLTNDDQTITIKTEKNSLLREASTAYQYVYSLENQYNGLTFFGHSKGLNNVIQEKLDKSKRTSPVGNFANISEWIIAMYYFGLNFKDEMLNTLMNMKCYYGPLLIAEEGKGWMYSGSFYWVNQENLLNTSKNIYETYSLIRNTSRVTAETMPCNLIPKLNFFYVTSHNNYYLNVKKGSALFDSYNNIDFIVKQCAGSEDDYNKFIDFYNSILNEIKIYKLDI